MPRRGQAELDETALGGSQVKRLRSAMLRVAAPQQIGAFLEHGVELHRAELLPHIVAEQKTIYRAASELDSARLLIAAMLADHRALVSLIADLALAEQPFETATIAASAQALFSTHLQRENDLLLPVLDAAGLDLTALLDGMHEILGHGEEAELDVRALPHGQRHGIIFGKLDALEVGGALIIVNDHDPKPLRYQTEALWPGKFDWTYLQAGPQLWRLAIRRVS